MTQTCLRCGAEKTPHPNGKGFMCAPCCNQARKANTPAYTPSGRFREKYLDDRDPMGHYPDGWRIERAKQKVRDMGLGR